MVSDEQGSNKNNKGNLCLVDMAFLDIFKKRRKKAEKLETKKPAKKPVKKPVKVEVAPKKKEPAKSPSDIQAGKEKKPVKKPAALKKPKVEVKVAPKVLKAPTITEKATDLAAKNQYIFKVNQGSVKPEIKKAIEEIYGVEVVKVRTINIPRQRRRLGRTMGWKQGYKKAIVSVREGQSIEVLPR